MIDEETKAFHQWMRNLDVKVQNLVGLATQDLVGYEWRSYWDQDWSVDQVIAHICEREGIESETH